MRSEREYSPTRTVLALAMLGVLIVLAIGDETGRGSAAASVSRTAPVSGLANLWVSTTGGSHPVRCSSPCAYAAASSYGSLAAAYSAAQPGDTVVVQCGTYPRTNFAGRKQNGPNVVFNPASPYCATLGLVDFSGGGDYSTLNQFTINDRQGAVYEGSNSVSRGVRLSSNHINVGQRVDTQDVDLHVVSGWSIVGNTIGPSCCGDGSSSPEGIRIGTPDGATAGNSSHVLISGNLIQFTLRSCEYWPDGYGACPSSDCSECHDDGIHVWGMTDSTISRNRIYGVEVQGIFFEPTNDSLNSNMAILNNMVTIVGGNAGIVINGCDCGGSTGGRWTIGFNSTPNLIEIDPDGVRPGTVFNLTGNIGALDIANSSGDAIGCTADGTGATINYVSNLWEPVGGGTPPTCGTGNVRGTAAFVDRLTDLHLARPGRAGMLVPSAICLATTKADIDGNRRADAARCDAGADQRLMVGAASSP